MHSVLLLDCVQIIYFWGVNSWKKLVMFINKKRRMHNFRTDASLQFVKYTINYFVYGKSGSAYTVTTQYTLYGWTL